MKGDFKNPSQPPFKKGGEEGRILNPSHPSFKRRETPFAIQKIYANTL